MGMIEISQRGRGGVKDAYDNFKESMKCLKEDFETLLDEMEEMGEHYGREDDRDYDRDYDREDRMSERRGRRRRR